MPKPLMSEKDVYGAWAIIPTPAKENGSDWRARDTVDIDETQRVVHSLIASGVNGILSMGTLGEAATLTIDEKRDYMRALVEAAEGRIPIFVGTTCLNTRDTIDLTNDALEIGADGTMLGLPMWCSPSEDMAVQFYKDVADAVPEMNIAIYANPEAFKFNFTSSFWARVSEIPQVIMAKYIGIDSLSDDFSAADGKIKLMPLDFDYCTAAQMNPSIDAFWSSGAVCDPIVITTLRDAVIAARASGDWSQALALHERMGPTAAPLFPDGSFKTFSMYNIGLEKARMDAAGWMKAGPVRPPYHLVPEQYLAGARKSGEMWAAIGRDLRAAI